MGNSTSRSETGSVDASGLSLDELGGWNRPAIKRGDSLNRKLEWLHVRPRHRQIDASRRRRFLQKAVRKQANLMEHELLKMPDLDGPLSPVPNEGVGGKPVWDSTFWNLTSQKRASGKETGLAELMAQLRDSNGAENEGVKEEKRNSKSKQRSWKQTIRTRVQKRLKELKQEEMEERRNNGFPTRQERQWPAWRLNIARAKIKILLYLKTVVMDARDDRGQPLTIRERSLPAYLMVRLGSCFPKFCQHQLHCLHSRKPAASPCFGEDIDESLSELSGELNNEMALDDARDSEDAIEHQERDRSALLMQMLANRANAKWVEATTWTRPYVYDPATLILGRADIRIYKQLLIDYLQEGKIALKLIDNDVQAEVLDESGQTQHEPILQLDLWEQVKTFFPWKISTGKRIEGLPLLARRLLQTVTDLESLAGMSAVQRLKLVLCIDELQESFVRKLLRNAPEYSSPHRLPQGASRYLQEEAEMQISDMSPKRSAGSGWAILALKWPKTAYTLDIETNQPTYLQGTALQWLRDRGVDWINAQFVMDWERFVPDTTFDAEFCSTALYCSDERESNMAMEVMNSASSRDGWNAANAVLGRAENNRHCCSILSSNLLTPQTRALVSHQEASEGLVTCQQRFMIKTKALEELTLAPCGLRSDIEVHDGEAYLKFCISKITSVHGARCAAVLTTSLGPRLCDATLSSKWFHGISHRSRLTVHGSPIKRLMVQDRQTGFVAAAARCGVESGSVRIDTSQPCGQREVVVVFVVQNLVCRRTVALARAFARRETDELHIVTSVVGEQHIAAANAFLESFQSDAFLGDCVLRRRVLTRGAGRVTHVMEKYLNEVNATLLVMGSENLARESSETIGSFCMSVAKSFHDVPLLIVKVNSAGGAHRLRASHNGAVACGIRCLVEIRPTATPLLQWLLPRLQSDVDKLLLAKTRAVDHTDAATPAATRMLNAFVDKASHLGFPASPRPLKGEPLQSLDKAVCEDQIDVLALQINASKSLPAHAVQILKTVKSSILIYRDPAPPVQHR